MFDYKSPINVFQTQIELIEMEIENEIFKAVHKVGVTVDKEELLKALKYDREQYEKGYHAGCNANKWIPCSERLPEEEGKYLVTGIKGVVYMAEYVTGTIKEQPISMWWRIGGSKSNVIAWMELPPAYRGE